MPRHLTTVTPENVAIEYELAGVASRCAAAMVDVLLQVLGILVLVLIYALMELALHFSVAGWPTTVLIVGGFLLWWGYFVYFETVWNGQTPGKRLLRLRAVKYGAAPVDLPCAAIRGLVRVIDMAFLIGFIAILATPRNQRLGDFVAGTLVVKERPEWKGDLAQPKKIETREHPEAELVKNVELITPEQFEMAKRFIERSAELQPGLREQLAAKIAIPLMQHLGIEDRAGMVHSNLISAIYDRCVQDRGMR